MGVRFLVMLVIPVISVFTEITGSVDLGQEGCDCIVIKAFYEWDIYPQLISLSEVLRG
jgi:hypothetical protein